MSCTNANDKKLNALVEPSGGAFSFATIELEFGPYMNWGRWNHNTSRIDPLIAELGEAGFSVQLKHNSKETTWEDHGFVALRLDGKEIARADKVQHNRNYRNRISMMKELAAKAKEELKKNKA